MDGTAPISETKGSHNIGVIATISQDSAREADISDLAHYSLFVSYMWLAYLFLHYWLFSLKLFEYILCYIMI